MSDLGDPNAHAPSTKQWIAFATALVLLALTAVWIAGSRQGERRRVPTLDGRPLTGTWRVVEIRDGCALDQARPARTLFAIHPGRLPLAGPALHPCTSLEACTTRERTRALGTSPPPVPLSLLGSGCGDCGESHADVSWEDALLFPVGLDGALDPHARRLTAERETAREADGRCLRFRYSAELTRDAEALLYERRVEFGSANGSCAEHPEAPRACVAARRWHLERDN